MARPRNLVLSRDDLSLVVIALEDMVQSAEVGAVAGVPDAARIGRAAAALIARLRGGGGARLH